MDKERGRVLGKEKKREASTIRLKIRERGEGIKERKRERTLESFAVVA